MKKGRHREKEKVMKPVCICEYDQYMSGVDHLDQMINYTAHVQKMAQTVEKPIALPV